MSRMNHVMQVGDMVGDIHYYIEDYAYTYLKKQKGRENDIPLPFKSILS